MLATGLLCCWSRWRRIPLLDRDGSLRAGLLAGTLFAIECAGIYLGLQHTTVSRLTIFLYCAPFWLAALLPLFVPAGRLHGAQWIGLVLAFVGVLFAVSARADAVGSSRSWIGDALGIVAGAAWGLTTVVIRTSKLSSVSAEKLLLYQIAVSAVLLPPLSLALGESWRVTPTVATMVSLTLQTVVGAFGRTWSGCGWCATIR